MTSKHVPEGVVVDILVKLPVKSLLRFRCVCKEWWLLLNSEYFISKHLECSRKIKTDCIVVYKGNNAISLVSEETLDLVSSDINVPLTGLPTGLSGPVNGVISLSYYDGRILLCNPSTREFKELPLCINSRTPEFYDESVVDGFGFDEKSNDYKVVRIIRRCPVYRKGLDNDRVDMKVKVYSLGSDSWRELNRLTFPVVNICSSRESCNLNGACHWFISYFCGNEQRDVVMSFQMDTEVFEDTPIPRRIFNIKRVSFVSNSENLSLVLDEPCKLNGIYEVWVLREPGVQDSWTKQYTVIFTPSPYLMLYFPVPIGVSNNELLLLGGNDEIVLCDLHNTQNIKVLKAWQLWGAVPIKLAFYKESLVSLRRASDAV